MFNQLTAKRCFGILPAKGKLPNPGPKPDGGKPRGNPGAKGYTVNKM